MTDWCIIWSIATVAIGLAMPFLRFEVNRLEVMPDHRGPYRWAMTVK